MTSNIIKRSLGESTKDQESKAEVVEKNKRRKKELRGEENICESNKGNTPFSDLSSSPPKPPSRACFTSKVTLDSDGERGFARPEETLVVGAV